MLRRFRQFEELHRGLLPVLSREPDANAYVLPPKEVRLVASGSGHDGCALAMVMGCTAGDDEL